MNKTIVRIKNIEIENFKNVRYGKISFENKSKSYTSSILGLYGQNGSGKTALIHAISLLKIVLSGKPVPHELVDFINVDAEYASLKYGFIISDNESGMEYTAFYKFRIGKSFDETVSNTEFNNDNAVKYKAIVFDEVISCSYKSSSEHSKLQNIIDTRTEGVFLPAAKYELLVGNSNKIMTELLADKRISSATSRSFIFSREFLNVLRKNCKIKPYLKLIESLVYYGNFELFVINTTSSGLITMNTLPLTFKFEEDGEASLGVIMINLNSVTMIPKKASDIVGKVVNSMNIVLRQLVPGLTIGLQLSGTDLFPDGREAYKVYLVSYKNGKEIPLQYESEGIKKIISILQLLIVLYNNPSITVAIDELDSGVFEYLLGELLRIISEKGKGQLIFTSHNLRPLETLDRGFIAFTTTNPDNRYIRFTNIKSNNNLRDFYYRDIMLGEQSEEVYESTNNYEIALAFREAGEWHGS